MGLGADGRVAGSKDCEMSWGRRVFGFGGQATRGQTLRYHGYGLFLTVIRTSLNIPRRKDCNNSQTRLAVSILSPNKLQSTYQYRKFLLKDRRTSHSTRPHHGISAPCKPWRWSLSQCHPDCALRRVAEERSSKWKKQSTVQESVELRNSN